MTNYVNWLKTSQMSKSGTTLQTQGNPVANSESPATGVASGAAPEGANYAMVWADVATRVQASPIRVQSEAGPDTGNYTVALPANTILEIPNIIPGETTVEMTDI